MNESTKTCTKCGETKHVSDFYAKERGKYGVMSWCKRCHLAMTTPNARAWQQAHRDRAYATHKRYRERTLDNRRAQNRRAYEQRMARIKANPELHARYLEHKRESQRAWRAARRHQAVDA